MIDEVNNRDKSLFVALAWSEKFPENMVLVHVKDILKLKPRIVFVAIKNGIHAGHDYAYYQGEIEKFATPDGVHVKDIHGIVMGYFKSKLI